MDCIVRLGWARLSTAKQCSWAYKVQAVEQLWLALPKVSHPPLPKGQIPLLRSGSVRGRLSSLLSFFEAVGLVCLTYLSC